jgi:hypothetical protein
LTAHCIVAVSSGIANNHCSVYQCADGRGAPWGVETLTLAPIDRSLIEPALLEAAEIGWLDAYHARVHEGLTPLVDADTRLWLAAATRRYSLP